MADEDGRTVDWGRAKKYHEGFAQHQMPKSKDWKTLWLVLRGNVLFVFNSQKTSQRTSHLGTLPLNYMTEVRNLPSERKKGYKIELTTTSNMGQCKVNKFKFDKENDRDLWKCFIIGIAKGQVPKDVSILPGQLKDVHEAIGDVRNTPPPPPPATTIPRPAIKPQKVATDTVRTNSSNGSGSSGSGAFGPIDYGDNFSFGPPNMNMDRRISDPANEPVSNLRQLHNRQTSLAAKSLVHEEVHSSSPTGSGWEMDSVPVSAAAMHQESLATESYGGSGFIHRFYSEPYKNREHPAWFFENCSREEAESILTVGKRFGNVLVRESVTFKSTGSYVISMRREVAGGTQLNHYEVKKMNEGFKINVDNPHSPMQCLSDVLDFFISVAGPQTRPMSSNNRASIGVPLSGGLGSPPLPDSDSGIGETNDRDEVEDSFRNVGLMRTQPPSPSAWNTGMSTGMNTVGASKLKLGVSGNIPPEMRDMVYGLRDEVEPPIQFSASTMPASAFGRRASQDRLSGGGWEQGQSPGYNTTSHPTSQYGWASSQVPAMIPPSETLQRNNGHDSFQGEFENLYLNEAELNSNSPPVTPQPSSSNWSFGPPSSQNNPPQSLSGYGTTPASTSYGGGGGVPSPPPFNTSSPQFSYGTTPPPSSYGGGGGVPSPPPFNTSSPQFSYGTTPPPASQGGGGVPAPPPFNTSSSQFATARARLMGSSGNKTGPPTSPKPNFNTQPAPRPRFGGPVSFEDELKNRLQVQKEDIYNSGTTFHRSGNW